VKDGSFCFVRVCVWPWLPPSFLPASSFATMPLSFRFGLLLDYFDALLVNKQAGGNDTLFDV